MKGAEREVTNFKWLEFSEVIRDRTGGNPKIKKSQYNTSGKVPIIDQGKDFISGFADDQRKICKVDLPVILFGDHTRAFKFLDQKFAMGADGVKVLSPLSNFDGKYLFYYLLQVNLPQDLGYSRHFKYLKECRFPVPWDKASGKPDIDEQKRIAAILDKADEVRRKRAQALELADQFLKSAFLDLFGDPVTNPKGWPVEALENMCGIASGVTKGRKFSGKATVHVPYMRVASVQDGYLDLRNITEIEVLPSEVHKYRLEPGDLLLTEGGDPDKLGRGAVWHGEISDCIHQNHIFRVRCQNGLLPEFLSAQIGSARGKRYFMKAAKQTTGIASINMTQLRAFPALVPPKDIQLKYEEVTASFKNKRQKWFLHAESANQLFSSLAQRAFRGEL